MRYLVFSAALVAIFVLVISSIGKSQDQRTDKSKKLTSNQMLMRLTDSKLPTTQPRDAALTPGEQRRIELPTRPGASRVACDVTFERNHYDTGSYELLLHTLRQSLSIGPR